MKTKTTWVVIADGARARIAAHRGPGTPLKAAFNYEFAAPHAPTRRFVSDRPGRFADPRGRSHGCGPKHDRHDYEKTAFARDLAQVLEAGASKGQYDRLVLVAPPPALGRLRAALYPMTRNRIGGEVPKDLTRLSLFQLPQHLRPVLPA